jgi:Flp pilus assembly protein TadG
VFQRNGLPKSDAGATAVEFACVAGILALLTLGVIDYGRAFWYRMQVQNAAQAAADWAQYNPFDCGRVGTTCVPPGLQNAVLYATNLPLTTASFTVTASTGNATCGCPDGSGGITTPMQCGSPCAVAVGGNATGYATVTVTYNFAPFFPSWPGLGNPVRLTGSATAICEGGETC